MASRKIIVGQVLQRADTVIQSNKNLDDDVRDVLSSLVSVVNLLANQLGLNSSNSSKPPSTDPNRLREKK